MKKIALLCATTALVMPGVAFAQSTGTIEFEKRRRSSSPAPAHADVGGVVVPDTSQDARAAERRVHPAPGPGPVDQRHDQQPAGRQLHQQRSVRLVRRQADHPRLRQQPHLARRSTAFRSNDTGNYAIFSNQLLDPEIIEQVNVSLGSTDVDSPTASATGSTVNFRTRRPYRELRRPHPGLVRRVRRRRFLPRVRRDRHRRVHALGHARLRLGQHGDQRFRLRPPRRHLQAAV